MNDEGIVREIRNAICLHEEDHGILWKHTDSDGHVEARRNRRFVVSSVMTVDNYEYGYFWYFMQDGSIEFEAKLTGIVLTSAKTARCRVSVCNRPGFRLYRSQSSAHFLRAPGRRYRRGGEHGG